MRERIDEETTLKNSLRISIFTRDKYTCQYCGRRAPSVELHVEHVISRHDGGSDHPSNLVASCVDCNYGKGKRSLLVDELYPVGRDPLFFLDFVAGQLPPAVPVLEEPKVYAQLSPDELNRRLLAVRDADDQAFLSYWDAENLMEDSRAILDDVAHWKFCWEQGEKFEDGLFPSV